MCTGYCYDLACGHKLIHYRTRCEKKCEIPEGPRSELNDTCAPCHPTFQTTSIIRKHDELREKLMKEIRIARYDDRPEEEIRINRLIGEEQAKMTAELAEVARLTSSMPAQVERVVWPGKNEASEAMTVADTLKMWKEKNGITG